MQGSKKSPNERERKKKRTEQEKIVGKKRRGLIVLISDHLSEKKIGGKDRGNSAVNDRIGNEE